MTEKRGRGSESAKKANAKAGHEGESKPRTSSAAQAELGKKGGEEQMKAGTTGLRWPGHAR